MNSVDLGFLMVCFVCCLGVFACLLVGLLLVGWFGLLAVDACGVVCYMLLALRMVGGFGCLL